MDLIVPPTPEQQNQPPARGPRSDVPRLERIRRRKRARRVRLIAVCVLVLAGILAYFAGLFGTSIALLGDVFDGVTVAFTPGEGFPAPFKLSGFLEAQPFAGGVVAVGEQDLAMISAKGTEYYRIQHNYTRPCVAVGNTRVCIYNRAGTQLRVESRGRNLFENTFQDSILLCAMSPNGTLAVFTKGLLTVYDPLFTQIFSFKTSELPTAMAFAADNRQFAVASPYAENGALGGTVYLFTTDPDAPAEATATIRNTEGLPLRIEYLTKNEVLVFYDTFAAAYNTADGAQLARYDYQGRTLQSAAVADGKNNAVLLFGDGTHSSQTQLVVLDRQLAELGAADVGRIAKGVCATRTGAYVFTGESVLSYGLDGTALGETLAGGRLLSLVPGKKLFLLTQNHMDVFDPPAPPVASA